MSAPELWMVLVYDKDPVDAVIRYGPFGSFEAALRAAKGALSEGTYRKAGLFSMGMKVELSEEAEAE